MPCKYLLFPLLAAGAFCLADAFAGESASTRRAEAERQLGLGNYENAAVLFRALALDRESDPAQAVEDLRKAGKAYLSLGLPKNAEDLLVEAEEAWSDSWRVLAACAGQRIGRPDMGDSYRWTNNRRNSAERDRARGIRLMLKAEKLLDGAAEPVAARDRLDFYRLFASIVSYMRLDRAAWRFTALTDLEQPPDDGGYDEFHGDRDRGAPVDADGNPVYYPLPSSWEAAGNDGERWRWLLWRMAAVGGPAGADEADWRFAGFLLDQFGVQTMGGYLNAARDGGDGKTDSGPFAVRTLGDDETIARLATGLKRFAMPDEFNHIRILRRLLDRKDGKFGFQAGHSLAEVYENRQQYPKAVAMRQRLLDIYPKTVQTGNIQALDRIIGNNGMLEAGPTAPAGTRTRIPYLFRNGKGVALTAYRLDERRLLRDIRQAYKSGGEDMFRNPALQRPEQLGRIVVERNAGKYIAEKTAEWRVELEPLPDHFSSRAFIEVPFDTAGCYLVEARMDNGNTSRVVMWISDLALIRKQLGTGQVVYVADAVTGKPAPGATVSFFGYSRRSQENSRVVFDTREFAEKTDKDGLALIDGGRMRGNAWLIIATTEDGRFAYLGFDSIWPQRHIQEPGREDAAFVITDRPVYRPGQKINFKVWIGNSSHAFKVWIGNSSNIERTQAYASGQPLRVSVMNPGGEAVFDQNLTTDQYGGVAGDLILDAGAPLGVYSIQIDRYNGYGYFRLEEYRKPEYEVTVETPDKALALGDTAQLKVKAKYYFGSPVSDARVAYKILRSPYRNIWYPPWRWDWLYGSGSSWQSYDYAWYPGWREWGVSRPPQAWMPPEFHGQPELVAEGEGRLDADGVFRLPLDTAPAKALYGDMDHRYEITVEVTDSSRRVIAGSGQVVAARKPFTAAVWADRGYYLAGQDIRVFIEARRPLAGGVAASGKAVLHRVRYDAGGNPVENEVDSWDVATDASGLAGLRLKAGEPGQYRLACTLADDSGIRVEGAALITVRGEKGEGDFRFASLELVADRNEYRPGDTVRLAVNSENREATVLLFPRAERMAETSGKPSVISLANGSAIVDIPVGRADRPNFFCEAITVYNGRMYSEVRQIFVPPADKTLDVEVKADKDSYAPGETAAFEVTVRDAGGMPASGEVVVSLYDKSVEYVSGGSNVGDIRSFFWSWKRSYHPGNFASLSRHGYRAFKNGDVEWWPIGVFGSQEAEWNDDAVHTNGRMMDEAGGDARSLRIVGMADKAAGSALLAAHAPLPAPMAAAAAPEARMQVARDRAAQPAEPAQAAGVGTDPMAGAAVRSEFADTALWIASLAVGESGKANFSLEMPENLTAWKARAWVMGPETRVGDGETLVETRKNVIVRPQVPRFLTQKDRAVLSANFHNYLPRAKQARVELVLEGGLLVPVEGIGLTRTVEIAANGEARVDWLVEARRPGEAGIVMKLLTDEESDAAGIRVPIIVHGARRVESFGGVIRGGENEAVIRLRVPDGRLPDQSRLELSFSPSIASSLIEALPFLIEYPYGCTEQTLNRFLPVVMTRKFLDGLGLDLADAAGAGSGERKDSLAGEWEKKFGVAPRLRKSPVFDDKELAAMIRTGVERLSSMQCSDGGWGWFSGAGERSWPHTTAVVAHGLIAAADLGAAIPDAVIESGVAWLRGYRDQQIDLLKEYVKTGGEKGKARADDLDALIHSVLTRKGRFSPDMRDFLYRDRLDLSLSGLAMLGIALHDEKATDALEIVLRNLEQFLETDADSGAAWLRTASTGWWWWYNSDVETQAWYLKLLSRTDPRGGAASGVAKYLLRNRKNGHYWRSTRDTAYAIEALAEYATASGETAPDMTVAIYLDGAKVMERVLGSESILSNNRFLLEGLAVETGDHELRVVRDGAGNLYYGGLLDMFSLEDPIARSGGGDLSVDRTYYKLVREETSESRRTAAGAAAPNRVEKYRRERLPSPFDAGADAQVKLEPGDLVEVELTIETRNDYEYLVFEDMKAAGIEAVELTSGYAGNRLGAYVEYRDQKVVLFVRHLPRGEYSLSYRFRAETPGSFSALPAFGGGMYATDLRAGSNEQKVVITEAGVFEERFSNANGSDAYKPGTPSVR